MRWSPLALSCAVGLFAFPIAACSDLGTANNGGSGGDGGFGGAGGSGNVAAGGSGGVGGSGSCVAVLIVVSGASPDGASPPAPSGPALEGVLVCELDNPDNCTMSDARGRFALCLPRNQETGYVMQKEGFGPRIIPNVTDDDFPTSDVWELFTDAQLEAIAEQIGTTYPWTGGITGLNLVASPAVSFAGVGLRSVDGEGTPFYLEDHDNWIYSPDLDETQPGSFAGFLPLALVGFAEVTPGVREFEVIGDVDCGVFQGWPASAPNRIRLPIVEGFHTYGSMGCEESAP